MPLYDHLPIWALLGSTPGPRPWQRPFPTNTASYEILQLIRLSAAPVSAREIAARTGIARNTVKVTMNRFRKRGWIYSPSRGLWQAIENKEE